MNSPSPSLTPSAPLASRWKWLLYGAALIGVTWVSLGHYVLASRAGMLPGTVMYVYLGSLAHVGSSQRSRTPGEWVLYGVGLLATAAVTLFVTRMARKALAGKIVPGASPLASGRHPPRPQPPNS